MSACALRVTGEDLTKLTGMPEQDPRAVARAAATDALRVNPFSAKGWLRLAQEKLRGNDAGTVELQ